MPESKDPENNDRPMPSRSIFTRSMKAAGILPPSTPLGASALKSASGEPGARNKIKNYSTVTDFARLRGWSTSQPRRTAM